MDFFERQNQARRITKLLLFYFIPAVVLIVLAVYSLVVGVVFWFSHHSHGFWDERILLLVSIGTLGFIFCAALDKIRELADGGRAIASLLGGRWVNPSTADPHEKQLRDIVEEMSIASGTSAPEIYVLQNEQGINAFVAGHQAGDAVLGVTEGALHLLTRDELQAVVAHEFSHLLNGDMRLNLRVVGIVNGILCIALLGKTLVRIAADSGDDSAGIFRRDRDDRAVIPAILIGLLLMAIGAIGYFFGRLIQCAVCRQREYLADAAAVQFTRHPEALAGALKKIGGLAPGSRLLAVGAEAMGHLFFGNALHDPWFGFLNTHPPLAKRIRLLDPRFDGNFPFVKSWAARVRAGEIPGETPPPAPPPNVETQRIIRLAALLNETPAKGVPLKYAVSLKASFPAELSQAAREPFGASALVYAILLSDDKEARAQQITEISAVLDTPLLGETQKFFPAVSSLSNAQKLALVNLALPTLRQLSGEQFNQFSQTIQTLIASDQQVSLFEFALQKIMFRNLPRFAPPRKTIIQFYALQPMFSECATLFSALARIGSTDESIIAESFALGVAKLKIPAGKVHLLPLDEHGLTQIDAALERLMQAALPIRKQVLTACACVVANDEVIQEPEAELLRAIAAALDCPLPPFVSELNAPANNHE